MQTHAVVFGAPGRLAVENVDLADVGEDDLVVESRFSGVSTGTERLLFKGRMPAFPGLGYPLVPGYETVGVVTDAGAHQRDRIGDTVYVPGCSAYRDVRGLFGGTAGRLVVPQSRAVTLAGDPQTEQTLLALAATAHHALHGGDDRDALVAKLPDLIVGNGVLGRLLARITVALGGAPTVWEADGRRRTQADGYDCIDPSDDERLDYRRIIDASGDTAIMAILLPRLGHGGEIVLAGFYGAQMSFPFPQAFMREMCLRVAAEFRPHDLAAVVQLVLDGRLDLSGLVTHHGRPGRAEQAYATAFDDTDCLKMVIDWGADA